VGVQAVPKSRERSERHRAAASVVGCGTGSLNNSQSAAGQHVCMPGMGKGFVMALGIETAHGHYDVLAAREGDDAPAGATHTVFGDGGSLAGYASADMAWGTDWAEIGRAGSLSDAAAMVAAVDGELLGFSADGSDFRGVDA
jgi:hypothetical protein